MNQLYRTIGISKQAVARYAARRAIFNDRVSALVSLAGDLRRSHPGCGVEKMYTVLRPDFMGRDRFVELFMDLGFRLDKKGNHKRTTHAGSIYYPNLIKGLQVDAPSVVWQSDITYIRVGETFYYAVFILDVYTKKIVGCRVSDHMRASANIKALQMALRENNPPMIHHSDRGSQYACKEYIRLLEDSGSRISMALSAQDNAYAERINGTIKTEYLDHWKPRSFEQLKRYVKKAVSHYNNRRPHNNIGRLAPVDFENKWWKKQLPTVPVFTIFDNESLT